jgi:ABC-type polysaccharide/polyol phosphate transport system ATPase subunit
MISSNIQKGNSEQMTSNKPQSTIDNQNSRDLQSQIRNPQSAIRNSNIAISVRKLSKKYQLYETPKQRLKEALHPFKKKYHREFWALKDVSFEARHGEIVGIIGRNGSGKSTILQLISGTLTPTQGNVIVNGRVSALLELGAGFNPQFTGKENVYMNAAIMGLSREDIDTRYDGIVAFADIGNFIDQPVKTYSSGMYIRLAFACAINVDPEILIIDEALAVGDARFQRKCYAKLEEFRKSGKTILFVSHNTEIINQICDHAMLLDKGQIIEKGEPRQITELYYNMLFGEKFELDPKATAKENKKAKSEPQKDKQRQLAEKEELERKKVKELAIQKLKNHNGDKKAEIIDFGILDQNGEKTDILEMGGKYTFFSNVLICVDLDDVVLGFPIRTVTGIVLFGTNSYRQKIKIPPQKKGDILIGKVNVTMWLAPGNYFLTFNVGGINPWSSYDRRSDALHFKVIGDSKGEGVVNLNPKMEVANFT